jgi:lipoprotein-anchoring transpeptidase ErfK/SrfK
MYKIWNWMLVATVVALTVYVIVDGPTPSFQFPAAAVVDGDVSASPPAAAVNPVAATTSESEQANPAPQLPQPALRRTAKLNLDARRYLRLSKEAMVGDDPIRAALYGAAFVGKGKAAGGPELLAATTELDRLERTSVTGANEAATVGDATRQHRHLTVAYLACQDPGRRSGYRAILDQLAASQIFSRRPSDACAVYRVQPGDSLGRIAARYNFPVEGIQQINGLRSTVIRVGQALKIPKGSVEVFVWKHDFRLVVLCGGLYLREFAIGTGKDDSTPEATFAIEAKAVDPTWYAPDGVYPPGHPKNLLGTRWLGFRDTAEHHGFGIHGTRFPESIGRAESSGCVRLRNRDVEDLFALIPRGARVTVVW